MTFCSSCGSKIGDGEKFCSSCGTLVVTAAENSPPANEKTSPVNENVFPITENVSPINENTSPITENFSPVTENTAPIPTPPPVTQNPPPANRNNGGDNFSKTVDDTLNKIKKLDFKKILKPAIAVVAAIIVICVLINLVIGNKYEEQKHSILAFENDGVYTFFLDGKEKAKFDVDDGSITKRVVSFNAKSSAFIYCEDSIDSNGELYLFDGKKKIKKIDEEVYDLAISENGKSIAYLTEQERDSDTGLTTYTLKLYKSGKSKVVADGVSDNFCLSPNGKTVGYTVKEYESNEDEDEDTSSWSYDYEYSYESFVWKGKAKSIGKDTEIIAVADNYKYVYYSKNDNTYAQKKLKSDKKIKLGDNVSSLTFNKKMDECFYSEDGKAKIVSKAKEVFSLKDSGDLIAPAVIPVKGEALDNYVRYGVSNFKNTFYYDGDTVYFISKKFEASKVAKCDDALLDKDGKTIFYLKDAGSRGEIYKINGKQENAEPRLLVSDANEPSDFMITENGKGVYYSNYDGEIYYQKGTGKSKQIGEYDIDDISYYNLQSSLYKGKYIYWIEDGELKRAKGSGKAKTIGNFDGDVKTVICIMNLVQVAADDDEDYYTYLSKNGKKFELLSTRNMGFNIG
jgi:hypothetical protein